MAAKLGQSNMVILLLNAGANPDTKDSGFRSAIFYSIEINDFDSIYALVDHGCDLSLVDEFQKSPVDYAFQKKHLTLIAYLFKKGGTLADNTKRKRKSFSLEFLLKKKKKLSFFYSLIFTQQFNFIKFSYYYFYYIVLN